MEKICFILIKIAVADQIKVLDRKITQNEGQYDLDRKAAKISALLSENLKKYEYLTGGDLDYKPSAVEKPKFKYSPLRKIFNKGLKEEDKKKGLFKRLKNIKDKSKERLKAKKKKKKKNRSKNIKAVTDFVKESLILEAKELIEEIKIMQKDVDKKLQVATKLRMILVSMKHLESYSDIYRHYKIMIIHEAEKKQGELMNHLVL